MNRLHRTYLIALCLFVDGLCGNVPSGHCALDALDAAKRSVSFLTDRVSTQGGYLWRYSSDLSLREGEGVS